MALTQGPVSASPALERTKTKFRYTSIEFVAFTDKCDPMLENEQEAGDCWAGEQNRRIGTGADV